MNLGHVWRAILAPFSRTAGARCAPKPPSNLSYLNSCIVYVVGNEIAPKIPSSDGGEIAQYAVEPALPPGLTLDANTGIISGTPTTISSALIYKVTGTNLSGNTTTNILIEVSPSSSKEAPSTPAALRSTYHVARPEHLSSPGDPHPSDGISKACKSPGLQPATEDSQIVLDDGARNNGSEIAVAKSSQLRKWERVADISTIRGAHTATRLHDGTVLVAGGISFACCTNTSELFHPNTGTWESVGEMCVARRNHTATLLSDGSVLVIGGCDSDNDIQASAEIYLPDSKSWVPVSDKCLARIAHTATLLADGTVLVAGGISGAAATKSAMLYHPDSKSWETIASMRFAHDYHTATLLRDGSVLIAGGNSFCAVPVNAERYHPSTKSWTGAVMNHSREDHTATLLPNDSVLITGGSPGLSCAEVYLPQRNYCQQLPSNMSVPRWFHTATLLHDETVLIVGAGSAELYHYKSGSWEAIGSACAYQTATLLCDGSVLFIDGGNTRRCELYLP